MTKTEKLKTALVSGEKLTAKQISARFGLKNPHEAIRQLRNEGICVYSNEAVLATGKQVVKYRVGTPSKAMVAAAARLAGAELFA
jgi:chemotaxis receptor (MCP) glutamine deamidase CheD